MEHRDSHKQKLKRILLSAGGGFARGAGVAYVSQFLPRWRGKAISTGGQPVSNAILIAGKRGANLPGIGPVSGVDVVNVMGKKWWPPLVGALTASYYGGRQIAEEYGVPQIREAKRRLSESIRRKMGVVD